MYGDKITGSMQRAIDETDRRRKKQIEHNELHGIVPQALNKPITDIMDVGDDSAHPASGKVKLRKIAEKEKTYQKMTATQMMDKVAELEKTMFEAARELEFEKAASLRDDIEKLRSEIVKIS